MPCWPHRQKHRSRLFGYVGNYTHGVPFQTSWIEVCAVFCKKPWFINNAIVINLHSSESRIRQHSFFFKATLDWNWHLSANVEPLKAHRPLSGFMFVFLKSSLQVNVVKWSWDVVHSTEVALKLFHPAASRLTPGDEFLSAGLWETKVLLRKSERPPIYSVLNTI